MSTQVTPTLLSWQTTLNRYLEGNTFSTCLFNLQCPEACGIAKLTSFWAPLRSIWAPSFWATDEFLSTTDEFLSHWGVFEPLMSFWANEFLSTTEEFLSTTEEFLNANYAFERHWGVFEHQLCFWAPPMSFSAPLRSFFLKWCIINVRLQLPLHTRNFLLRVVVVAWRQQVTEDQRRDKHLLCLMLHDRNSFAVIPDLDLVVLTVKQK